MHDVLTLVAAPGDMLYPETIEDVTDALAAMGAHLGTIDVLAAGSAIDIGFAGPTPAAVDSTVRTVLAGRPIDLLAQPTAGRRKAMLIADMDSTIITVECIDELADYLGIKAEIAAITERAMRGELDFPAALRERVARLAGLSLDMLDTCFRERIRLTPGARALVRTMRANGALTALVSGGFTYFTARVATMAGFDVNRANVLGHNGQALDGTVAEPILGADAKAATLGELARARGLDPGDVLAVGDGANDIPMLKLAGLGVAYRAKPATAAAAGARVDHGDLSTLLFFQGYRRAQFHEHR